MTKQKALILISSGYDHAVRKYPVRFHSLHEGYAIILEELDELRAEIWKRSDKREQRRLVEEAQQVGAMALRFLIECC